VCGSPKQERIVNSISDVGADGEYFVAGGLMPKGQVVFGGRCGKLAAALAALASWQVSGGIAGGKSYGSAGGLKWRILGGKGQESSVFWRVFGMSFLDNYLL
jgi:hypothetical protein